MDLSIVIVNYRAWEDLALCLDSLTALKEALNCEVIVVDNASGDGRLASCKQRFSWARFISAGF